MNWGDELCGVVVTPQMCFESGGWIVQHGNGRWVMHQKLTKGDHFYLEYGDEIRWESACMESRSVSYGSYGKVSDCRPIFPPAGFAGKEEFELFEAVLTDGIWDKLLFEDEKWEIYINFDGKVSLKAGRPQMESYGSYRGDYAVIEEEEIDPAALILALQNAQVLAARLGGGK